MATILVVDDQEDILQTTALVLRKGGYDVLTAPNGLEAMSVARAQRPDLILLDIEMPRMDGWETLRLLRLDDATRELPVAMFTILFDLREKVRALKYGAQDYITKPFSVDDLLDRVAGILGGLRLRDGGEVTDRKRSEDDQLRTDYLRLKSAVYDPNTQLQSAAALIETVRGIFQRTRSVGVVHIEIDPLARVETVYGWQVLDDLLRRVAFLLGSLKGGVLPAEALLCQTGICAERFVVIVPISRAEEASPSGQLTRMARTIQDLIEKDLAGSEFAGMGPKPAIAVGAVTVTEHPFFRLERQLYRAIEEARIAASRGEVHERNRQHAELKRIIRDQNVEVVFQAVLNLETGNIIGYEAFTRGPRDSIFETSTSLFEYSREVGMTAELDLLCQKAVLRQARRLVAGEILFLNTLPASLDPGFRESLLAGLPDGFPLTRGDIVLDIGDMNSIEDYEAFGTEVTDLRARGFRMALDDVGKGASTLENISEVGPDFIKIDNSLVHNIDKSLIKQEVVRSLCQAAGAINAIVIAEGIETNEEKETVMRCGASHGQGYLFFRPSRDLPANRVRYQRADM